MPYQGNKPLSTDQLSQSQADIATNFTLLGSMLDPSTGVAVLTLPTPSTPPTPVITAMKFYAAALPGATIPPVADKVTGGVETYLSRTDGTNNFYIPFTASLQQVPGWTYLPSGIIMKWGTLFVPANSDASVNFIGEAPTLPNVPRFKTVLNVTLGGRVSGGDNNTSWIGITTYNSQSITLHNQGSTGHNVDFLVIGY